MLHFVGCGSAYHVGAAAQYVLEDLARIPVRVELASEFRYRRPLLGKRDLVVLVSQSGETADTLAALRVLMTGKTAIQEVLLFPQMKNEVRSTKAEDEKKQE